MQSFKRILLWAALTTVCAAASAADRSQYSTIKFVYALSNGDFVIGLNTTVRIAQDLRRQST